MLDKRIPGRPSTLDEAKAGIREQLLDVAAKKLLAERSKEAADRINKGEDIHAVAKALNTKVDGASNFGIGDSIPELGPAAFLEEAFVKGTGAVIGPKALQGRTVVAKVISKTNADMAGLAAERSSILAGLKGARAQQTNRLWMDSIVRDLTESGDLVVNQAAIQQVVAQLSR